MNTDWGTIGAEMFVKLLRVQVNLNQELKDFWRMAGTEDHKRIYARLTGAEQDYLTHVLFPNLYEQIRGEDD